LWKAAFYLLSEKWMMSFSSWEEKSRGGSIITCVDLFLRQSLYFHQRLGRGAMHRVCDGMSINPLTSLGRLRTKIGFVSTRRFTKARLSMIRGG